MIEVPPAPRPEPAALRVLWLGTVKEDKRPRWMLAAARALPDVRFVIAGGPPPPPMSGDCERSLRSEVERMPNVEMTGFVEPARVPDLLSGASLFAHTSAAEGFPNTLLEAWAYGVPSVSVVDPDQAVSAFGAGVRVDDEDEFVEAIRGLMYDPDRRRELGTAARAYVLEHHSPDAVARSFERALGLAAPEANARATGAA